MLNKTSIEVLQNAVKRLEDEAKEIQTTVEQIEMHAKAKRNEVGLILKQINDIHYTISILTHNADAR